MIPKPRCALLKKPSQQIIIASQLRKSHCTANCLSQALHVLWMFCMPLVEILLPKQLPVTKICHWICMKQNMHAYMERMYNYYNYSRALCIECWVFTISYWDLIKLPYLVEVGLRPQNAIWIFRAPRGIIFRYGNCEMVSSRRPCFYASIWKILQKKISHFRLWTIGGEWCLLLHQPPRPFGMICFGSCNR